MSKYGYPEYVPVAERKRKAQKAVDTLKKKKPDIAPIIIEGRKLTRTWWGKSWNDNLESYSDYSNRIGRGRSYVRSGAVLDLQITPGNIHALVQGSRKKPYQVDIAIQPLTKGTWEAITKACAGKIHSLQELIEGKFPKALADLFTLQGKGLFPAPKEISLQCSCPDWAVMCKHVAAVLYGVGVRLDDNPSLFFVLRKVNIEELISETITGKSQSLLEKSKTKSSRVIDYIDVSSLFGIEVEAEPIKINSENKKDHVDFEEWEGEAEFINQKDWEALVKYRYRQAEKYPDDPYCQWSLGEAYVLNKEYEKAIYFLAGLHNKYPDDPNIQHSLLDALFAIGKDQTAIDWIVKPNILRLDNDILDYCYNFLKRKRKPRTVHELHIELLSEGYPAFDDNQLMEFLHTDNRFVVKGSNTKSYDCFVNVTRKKIYG